jgi:hypothetical protein
MSAPDWMLARLPASAIPVDERMPPDYREVMVWISDPDVAIHHYPTVARRDGKGWWAGVPGNWIALHNLRWTVTHWLPLPNSEAEHERA